MTDNGETALAAEFNQAAAKALDAPGVASELDRLERDRERRCPRSVRPKVVTTSADADLEGLIPPGSVLIMFAPCGSDALSRIEAAFAAGDGESLRTTQSQLPELLAKRSVKSMREAVDEITALPAYFDFRYSGRELASGVGLVADLDLGSLLFITNGGSLSPDEFNVVEYHEATRSPEPVYDYLVVHREGRLSDLEQKVLAAVPPDELEFNIARGGPLGVMPAALVWVLLVTLTGTACLMLEQELSRLELTPEQVEKLGERASARELLAMRRGVQERLAAS